MRGRENLTFQWALRAYIDDAQGTLERTLRRVLREELQHAV